MKKKVLGWSGIFIAIGLIVLGIFSVIIKDYKAVIAIPVGIYMVFKFLPSIKTKVEHD